MFVKPFCLRVCKAGSSLYSYKEMCTRCQSQINTQRTLKFDHTGGSVFSIFSRLAGAANDGSHDLQCHEPAPYCTSLAVKRCVQLNEALCRPISV